MKKKTEQSFSPGVHGLLEIEARGGRANTDLWPLIAAGHGDVPFAPGITFDILTTTTTAEVVIQSEGAPVGIIALAWCPGQVSNFVWSVIRSFGRCELPPEFNHDQAPDCIWAAMSQLVPFAELGEEQNLGLQLFVAQLPSQILRWVASRN